MQLMYKDIVIGQFNENGIKILNHTQESSFILGAQTEVSKDKLVSFISDRIISSSRRDIDKFLNSNGLIKYDVFEIAKITRLINPMDSFWLKENESETYDNFVIPKLTSMFKDESLRVNNTMSSGGQNIKFYTKFKDKFGITKKRLTGLTYDTESEIAVYKLSGLLNIETCPVYRVDSEHSFSEFKYNFLKEHIVHMRSALKNINYNEEIFKQIVAQYPPIKTDLIKMIILDFITNQDDRHLSNFSLIDNKLYPLYDNGRSLFWENRESYIQEAINDVPNYSSSFGNVGSYFDLILELSNKGTKFGELVNLDLKETDIILLLTESGYDSSRSELITKWILNTIEILKNLDRDLDIYKTKSSNIFS